jgi:hypothetical protein
VVGDAICPVVEDVVVGGDLRFGEVVAGYRSLGDGRWLGQDALAGAAGVELVRRKYSADFEWFVH